MLNSQRFTSQMYLLAVYDHPHILDETVHDLKCLCCRRPSLVLGESVQPLENRIDLILSKKLLHKFLCSSLSRVMNTSVMTNSLDRPCLICFVTSARIESSSTIIFTTISVKAGVGGTFVYISRRLRKCSTDSSKSTRKSKSAETPLNA
jgi:hypothetical protein